MLSTYNRKKLRVLTTSDELHAYYNSHEKTGLEWNMYIGRLIITDLIKQLSDYDGVDFQAYMTVLPYIEYGLFQSAIKVIEAIDIPELAEVKTWLVNALTEGEDRYE